MAALSTNADGAIDVSGDGQVTMKLGKNSQYVDGEGMKPEDGLVATIKYMATIDGDMGQKFDVRPRDGDSTSRGLRVALGGEGAILPKGVDMAVRLLRIGGRAVVTIAPGEFAFGDDGIPGKVDPADTVVYYIQLVDLEEEEEEWEDEEDEKELPVHGMGGPAGSFALNVKLFVKPERREAFLACIKANERGTLTTEPLACVYAWGECTKEPNTFHFHEQYLGKEGFDAHAATPHFADWEAFAATDPFTKEPEVSFFDTYRRAP